LPGGGLADEGDPAVAAVGDGDFSGAVGGDGFGGPAAVAGLYSAGFALLGRCASLAAGVAAPGPADAADVGGFAGDAEVAPGDDFPGGGDASACGFLPGEKTMPCGLAGSEAIVGR
jgi:hypothetical protein